MMSDADTPLVTTPENLVPRHAPGGSLIDRWIEADVDNALKRIEARVLMLEALRKASIRATYPSDWLIHVSRDHEGGIIAERGYLQDMGAERAAKIWGVELGEPTVRREDLPSSTYIYHMSGDAWSHVTGERLDYVEGSRWSGDRFFQRGLAEGETLDPTIVRKAAYANMHGRAVRALSGLNGVPLDVLRHAGLDVSHVVVIDYEKGAKGGQSSGVRVGADVVVGFGRSAGKRPDELDDRDLTWYLEAYKGNVDNPSKVQYRAKNQMVLDALKLEREHRASPPADDDASRGQKLTDLRTRLVDVANKSSSPLTVVVKALTLAVLKVELANLTDLSDEQLDQLARLDDLALEAGAQPKVSR